MGEKLKEARDDPSGTAVFALDKALEAQYPDIAARHSINRNFAKAISYFVAWHLSTIVQGYVGSDGAFDSVPWLAGFALKYVACSQTYSWAEELVRESLIPAAKVVKDRVVRMQCTRKPRDHPGENLVEEPAGWGLFNPFNWGIDTIPSPEHSEHSPKRSAIPLPPQG